MASSSTQNFHLNQWALSDDVRMEDFNADNAALETALSGMMQYVTGSYTGSGESGAEHPKTLTLNFAPVLVVVTADDGNGVWSQMIAFRGAPFATVMHNYGANVSRSAVTLTWGDRSVSWYGSSASVMSNSANTVYHYAAIGRATPPV